jgi:transposase
MMPRKRTSMTKTREVMRLHGQAELSHRQISILAGISRPVVSKIISIMNDECIGYEDAKGLSDSDLKELLSSKRTCKSKADLLREKFPDYATELKKTGVTIRLLWEEYIHVNPEGLKYTQFCLHFQRWRKDDKISMHINHKAGDKMMVDYAGDKLKITSRKTGRTKDAEIFVAILPASQLTYVEASLSQEQESFMRANERALRYFGGVPSAIVPDNLKSGVLKADWYEPILNPLFADFAEYYRTAVVPARARKPKDKAAAENAVKIIYTRIHAVLRNRTFYSLDELNEAIREKLEDHNNKTLDKMTVSRRELFDLVEKETLKSLPMNPYPLKYFQNNCRVAFNYHVQLKEDQHYYSVPHFLKGKIVKIIYDDRNVAIYHENIRIVQHFRDTSTYKYTTVKNHMPSHHRFADDWNPDKLKWWAGNVGEETLRVVSHILESKPYPEQAYKSCLGVLSLAEKCGHDVLNQACRKSWNMERIHYQFIKEQAHSIKEQYERKMESKQLSLLPENHENIRGKQYYK